MVDHLDADAHRMRSHGRFDHDVDFPFLSGDEILEKSRPEDARSGRCEMTLQQLNEVLEHVGSLWHALAQTFRPVSWAHCDLGNHVLTVLVGLRSQARPVIAPHISNVSWLSPK